MRRASQRAGRPSRRLKRLQMTSVTQGDVEEVRPMTLGIWFATGLRCVQNREDRTGRLTRSTKFSIAGWWPG
jgi:hypothetical protein